MSTTDTNTTETRSSDTRTSDLKLEVAVLPVADADRAKAFYTALGWREDADFPISEGFRVLQFTPPGSQKSSSEPGSIGSRLQAGPPNGLSSNVGPGGRGARQARRYGSGGDRQHCRRLGQSHPQPAPTGTSQAYTALSGRSECSLLP